MAGMLVCSSNADAISWHPDHEAVELLSGPLGTGIYDPHGHGLPLLFAVSSPSPRNSTATTSARRPSKVTWPPPREATRGGHP